MPATSPEAIKRKIEARKAKREAAKAARAAAETPAPVCGDTIIPTAKFESVEPVIAAPVIAAPVIAEPVIAAPVIAAPVIRAGIPMCPYQVWLASPQGLKLRHLGGVNMDRLHHAYADRVEAIFKAGYAAGVGDGI
jgi:hypothetical protein